MKPSTNPNSAERIGSLETGVAVLREDMAEVRKTLVAINDKLSVGRETNWSNWLGAAVLVMTIYAAAIRPIQNDAERIQGAAQELAKAVIVQNEKVQQLSIEVTQHGAQVAVNKEAIAAIVREGSPITDKRLLLVEYQIQQLANPKK